MGRKRPFLTAALRGSVRRLLLASVAFSCAQAVPAVYADTNATWNSTTGNWSDFTKWSTNPNFPNNGTPASVLYDVTVNGGAITLDVSPTIQTLSLNGGTIGTGNLTVVGAFNVVTGTLASVALTGTMLLNTTSAQVTVVGTTSFTAARLSANNATLNLAPGYTLNSLVSAEGATAGTRVINLAVGGGGTETVGASGIVRLTAGTGAGLLLQNSSTATLVNNGLISAEATGQTLTIQNTALTNNATIQALAGTVTLSATNWTNAGTISGASGTILNFSGAWSDPGTLSITSATLNLGGTFATSGFNFAGFTNSSGTVNLSATLTNTSSVLTLNAASGSWNFLGGIINGGSVVESGALLVLTSTGGTLSNVAFSGGDLLLNTTSAQVTVVGTTSFTAARLSANNATLNLAPGYTLNSLVSAEGATAGTRVINLAVGGGGTETVGASGIVRLTAGTGAGLLLQNSSTATLVNNGLISAEATGQTLTIQNTALTNNATIQALAGTVTLSATNWTNAGTISGASGTILNFSGAWSDPGTLSITSATLNLGGTFATSGFNFAGFTNSSGTVNLSATLTNTSSVLTLNAASGSWNFLGGIINGGSVVESGALLVLTSTGGTLSNVAFSGGDLLLNTTSAQVTVVGTTSFTAARLSANNATLNLAPGYTLNSLVSAEGATAGTRVINLAVGGGGTETVGASGIVRLTAGTGAGLLLQNSSTATLVNNGLISAEATGQTLTIQNTALTNNATIQALAGTVTLSATNWTNAGTISGASGTILNFSGAWSDPGTLSITSATLNLGGTFATSGFNFAGFTNSSGTVNLSATLTNTSSVLTLNAASGSWNFLGGIINGGSVVESGALLVLTSTGGTLSNVAFSGGDLLLNTTSAQVTVVGTTSFTAARLSANNATLNLAPGYTLNSLVSAEGATAGTRVINLAVGGGGTETVGASGIVRLTAGTGAGLLLQNSSTATLVNNGLISAEATGQTLTIQNTALTNNATIQALAGTVTLSATNWTNAGTISGASGTILNFSGAWSDPGTLSITSATLNLGGTFATSGFNFAGFTNSSGTVNLSATLTNTSSVLTLNAASGSWNFLGGIINGGSVVESGALLVLTSTGGTLSNVAFSGGDLLLNTTSAQVTVVGTTSFTAARLSANNATLNLAPGYTLNSLVSAEGATAGTRVINLAVGGGGTETVGASGIVRLTAGTGAGLLLQNSSTATLVNNGLISAEASAQTLLFNNTTLTNNATIQVIAAGTVNINTTSFTNSGTLSASGSGTLTVTPIPTNFSAGTLTGGTWDAFANSTLNLSGLTSNITTNAASVTLSGTGSVFSRFTNGLATNNGSFFLLAGRSFTAAGALTNNGLLQLGGGALSATTTLTNSSTGTLLGFGSVALRLANSGLVEVTGGTLVFSDGMSGAGTIQTDPTGILSLTGGVSGTSGSALINNGSLTLGNNNVSITGSYTNANFGTGNSFNKHANVSTAGGQILAVGGNTQTLTGNVANGATSTPSIAFNNVHMGDVVTKSYQINNTGASGPSVLYALQTSVGGGAITDGRLSGAGVSSSNVGPVAIGAASPSLGVTLTASSDGPLTGQTVHIANNFDNITEQTLSITGTAYNYAAPVVSGNPINFGNVHVNATVAPVAYTLKNNAPNDGFSEALDSSLTGASGTIAIAGSPPSLAPQASSTAITATLNTSSAGAQSGSVTLNLTSDGTGSSGLTSTPLNPVTLTASGAVYNFAAPQLANSTVNFGSVHVGDVVAPLTYSLKNNAPSGGFSESLDGALSGVTGNLAISGSVPLLPAQSTSTALTATLDTSTPGVKSGSATLNFTSDGTGTSGLPSTPQGSAGLTASGTVYNYAVAALQKSSGSGTFTVNDPTHATLDFGILNTGDPVSANLSILNTATLLADTLAGSWTLSAPDFSFTNFGPFTNIAGGGSLAGLQVNLTAGASGLYTETAVLHPLSQDNAPFNGTLPDYTLTLKVAVNPLEATWNGGTGNWSTGTQWTTTPTSPNNGVPTNAQYNATIATGAVTLDEDINIRAVSVSGGSLSNAAHALTLSSGMTVSGGTFNLSGTGSLSAASLTASPGGTFTQTGGTVTFSSSLSQSGGAISLGGSQTLYSIPTVSLTGGTTTFTTSVKKVLVTSSLTVSGTAQLDVTKGDLMVHSTVGNLTADDTRLQGYLNASEIRSSLASGTTGVGLMKGSDYLLLQGAAATFTGQAVVSTDLLVRYTYLGDATFDGKVTVADYSQIDGGFLLGGFNGTTKVAQWVNGDFNGDGLVNYKDYALIDAGFAAYQGSGTPLAQAEIAQHTAEFGAPYVAALDAALGEQTSVPEPASLVLLTLGSASLLCRKRRSALHCTGQTH